MTDSAPPTAPPNRSPAKTPAGESSPDGAQLVRVLGITTAAMIVVGNTIGSGIFVKPSIIAEALGDFRLIMLTWVVGGVLCIFGGLCLAELGAMLPKAGGLYVYLREAYGPWAAFLFGWNELLFNRPAASGALSIIFVRSLAGLGGRTLTNLEEVFLAVLIVLGLAAINIRGVGWGGAVQNSTTFVKIGSLVLIILLPIVLLPLGRSDFSLSNWQQIESPVAEGSLATRFGIALLAVMWAYNGWHGVTPIAEEIRHPERNVPLALFVGIGIIVALYLGANLAYHGVLPMRAVMAAHEKPAQVMLESLLGPIGGTLIAAVLVCSTLGAMNGDLLIAPRISFAMGRDRVFFQVFAKIHKRFHTPIVAILVQAVMTGALVLASGLLVEFYPTFQQDSVFELLSNFVIFAASIFYVLAVVAVPVLRWRRPEWARPYHAWGYPLVPLAFFAVYAWFLWEVYASRPFEANSGLVLIALGIPVYLYFARRNRRERTV